jgi:hypothetical protein
MGSMEAEMSDRRFQTLDLSRRNFLRGASLAAGAGALMGAGLAAPPAMAANKFSQSMAKYQPSPKGAQRCDGCTQFQPADACKVVEGKIAASGWCFLFTAKAR